MHAALLAALLPTLNATLNLTCAILLVAGYACIRRKAVEAHRRCMLAAFGVSVVFLGSYLTLRGVAGMTRFEGDGWLRVVYLAVLLSHSALAALVVPMSLLLLRHAFREAFDRHARLGRLALPIWLYVSLTGVLVYLMLYHGVPRH
jgi:putative membrane protein